MPLTNALCALYLFLPVPDHMRILNWYPGLSGYDHHVPSTVPIHTPWLPTAFAYQNVVDKVGLKRPGLDLICTLVFPVQLPVAGLGLAPRGLLVVVVPGRLGLLAGLLLDVAAASRSDTVFVPGPAEWVAAAAGAAGMTMPKTGTAAPTVPMRHRTFFMTSTFRQGRQLRQDRHRTCRAASPASHPQSPVATLQQAGRGLMYMMRPYVTLAAGCPLPKRPVPPDRSRRGIRPAQLPAPYPQATPPAQQPFPELREHHQQWAPASWTGLSRGLSLNGVSGPITLSLVAWRERCRDVRDTGRRGEEDQDGADC